MKKINLLLLLSILWGNAMFAQVGVAINEDNSSSDASAMLDVKSTNKGMLVPRMTTAQRTAIASPATGLLVFDNTTNSFWFYQGSAWTELLAGTDSDDQDLSLTGNNLSLTNDASPVDLSPYLDNTDDQDLSLTGNTLSLTNDGTTVNLAGYLDNTDNQRTDVFQLVGNNLELSLQNDGIATQTVNLSSLVGTDNQALSLAGNTLSLVNGGSVSLAGYVNTDNQRTDVFQLVGNNLELSLQNDGVATQTVDLSGFLDADNLGNHTATTTLNMNNNNIINANIVSMRGLDSYDKLRVWSNGSYAIGMNSAMSFGYLNDYAMTFTMNQDDDRGWVWRDVSDAKTDGAASLTTNGRFTVKSILRSQGVLIVDGAATISSLAGAGTRMVVADAAGNLSTQAITIGDITGVTAGTGLTGGGTAGAITLNAVGTNGLTTNANDIRLGGTLIQGTTITQGANNMVYNLNGTGDFHIQDNGVNQFSVLDNGDVNADAATFYVDASTNRVGLGITAPTEDLHVFRPDTDVARVYATGTTQGSGMFYAGQSAVYGGGFVYDGDGTPALVGGTDRVTFFRRDNGTDTDVMSYGYNNSTVRITNLAGVGNRVVMANATGDLFTQTVASIGDNLGNHNATTTLDLNSNQIQEVSRLITLGTSDYDKLRVYSSNNYTIGMHDAMSFGYLNDWAMTFTMNQDDDRGWVWRDVNDAQTDGAASLTTNGRFTVKSILDSRGSLVVATDAAIDGNTFVVNAANNRIGVREAAPQTDIHLTQSNATTAGTGGMRFQYTTSFWKIFHSGIHFSFVDDGTRVAYVEGGTGNYVQPSDGSLKKNITNISSVLTGFSQLRPVSYHYTNMEDTDKKAVGFIAQEVESVFPEIVRESEDGFKALSYSDFAVLSVKAIQEQQKIIEDQNKKIETQQEKMDAMEQKMNKFEALLKESGLLKSDK